VLPTDDRQDEELNEPQAQPTGAQPGRPTPMRAAPAATKGRPPKQGGWKPEELDLDALRAIVDRTKTVLAPEEQRQLTSVVEAFAHITQQLETTTVTLARLRRFVFGTSEKTSKVLGDEASNPGADDATVDGNRSSSDEAASNEADADASEAKAKREDMKKKAPGHGRLGADAYTGAKKVQVPNATHHHGDRCPGCEKGKIYSLKNPRALVRITGVAPLNATVYECEQLRCNLCQEIFAAPPPEGVGLKKYDESATSMIAVVKYGVGLPFNRVEKMQHGMGVPMPAATQWDLVREGADSLRPLHDELVRQGAAADVLHNDDTVMKVLEITPEQREQLLGEENGDRSGVFTSGIIAARATGERIALFYTGPRHAGENIARLLAKRSGELPTPIQMSDALAANTSGEFKTIVANCLAHGRRYFVDAAPHFPNECRYVLETLRDVYKHDAEARKQGLSPEERLRLHQELSAPLMTKLRQWLDKQLDEHLVEPNSSLGEALSYLKKHWEKLTLFLRKAGAPLDNNICERALKKAILHRKNALFYKTLRGAAVGDLFMSIIHTCELNKVGAFDYLVAVLRHHEAVAKNPAEWMPWNYREALQRQ